MDKKEEFKKFISKHPELVNYIKNKENTWQDFYEIYDLYGDNDEVWSKYAKKKDTTDRTSSIDELTKLVKNVNMDNVQKYINNAQKAINVIKELTTKTDNVIPNIVPKTPRPITKFFGD